jgi:hypothetical protein
MIKNHTNGMGSAQQLKCVAVVPNFCKYNSSFCPYNSRSFVQQGDRGGLIPRPSMGGKHFGATFETPSIVQSIDDNYSTNSGVSRRDPIVMPIMEKPVSYSNIVSREIVVDNLEIPTTLAEGSFVKIYNVPNDLLANCQQKQAFNNNYLGRGNVKVKVIVSASQFHQGMLCVFWAPMLSKDVFTSVFTGDKTQISNLQCGYIDLNRPQPLEMVINFSHVENYLRLNASSDDSVDGSLGIFGVHVFDQLQVATGGSTVVNASIIVSFDGWEFYLPVAVDTCTSLSLSRKANRANVLKPVRSTTFEQQGNHFSNTHNSWTVIKNVADSTIAQEQHGDEFDTKQSADLQAEANLDVSNMDKPFIALNPPPITLKNSQYFNNDTNIEHLNKLTLVAGEQCPAKVAHFGRQQDECSIRHIAKIPSFIYEIPWTISNVPGDQLFSLLICPSPINTSIRPIPTGDTDPMSQSYLDYLSGQFQYWRARFNIHFKLVASNFQTGILRVGIVYGKYDVTATANEANCQFMRIIDLKEGQREYDFTTEFPATVQMLQCTSTHRTQLTADELDQCAVGTLYVHVINPLIVGVGATNNIHIQVFMSSTDVDYFWLRPAQVIAQAPVISLAAKLQQEKEKQRKGKAVVSPFSPPVGKSAFQQQSATGDFVPQPASGQAAMAAPGSVIGTTPATLVQVPKRGHATNIAPLHNIRMILKRYVKIFSTNNVANGITQSFTMSDLYETDTQPYQWLNMYVGVRGNSRYKVYQIGTGAGAQSFYQCWATVPFANPSPTTGSQFQCPWDLKTGSDNNHCFEEETSFVTQYNYLINPALSNTTEVPGYSTWGSFNTVLTYATGSGNSVLQTVLWAGGDDFRPGLLIGPMYSVVKQYAI